MRESVLVPSLGILLFNKGKIEPVTALLVLVPSLGILLFNIEKNLLSCKVWFVLVPSLGILLFNSTLIIK